MADEDYTSFEIRYISDNGYINGEAGGMMKKDGTVWATGYNGHGELSQGDRQNRSDFVQVKAYQNNPESHNLP